MFLTCICYVAGTRIIQRTQNGTNGAVICVNSEDLDK